jgi:hypothetical protein
MKKWIGPCLSVFLVLVLLFLSGPFAGSKQPTFLHGEDKEHPLVLTQDRKNEKRDDDSSFIQVLRGFQEIVEGWLKSLNERIESEDVTRFEVRFLEILRNMLEWVKEKIDAQIDSAREQQQRREKGTFRETRWRFNPFFNKG